MLKLSELREGVIYKADENKAPAGWLFSVINGNLHSDQGRANGDVTKAKIEMSAFRIKSGKDFIFGPCTYVFADTTFTVVEEVTNNGEQISQGVATMKEGQVYKVELLTGKQITVDETIGARVVVIGGTTYRLGKKDSKGTRKLRPLKSKLSTKEPVAVS